MLDIEKYQKQAQKLQACINNVNSAIGHKKDLLNSINSTIDDLSESDEAIERCEQTLIGQLKLMNIQNKEDLES